MIPRSVRVASATLACLALFPCAASAAMSCAALATLQLPETTITAAHEVPAGSLHAAWNVQPHCPIYRRFAG